MIHVERVGGGSTVSLKEMIKPRFGDEEGRATHAGGSRITVNEI